MPQSTIFIPTKILLSDILVALRGILNNIARPLWVDPGTSRVKADTSIIANQDLRNITGTVATVTTVNQLAGFDAKQTLLYNTSRTAWAVNVRRNIT